MNVTITFANKVESYYISQSQFLDVVRDCAL